MIQERISWNIGFHVGKWTSSIKYVYKIDRDFRTTIDNSKWRMYVAKLMLNWKDPMVECGTTKSIPVYTNNHCTKPVTIQPIYVFSV